MQDIRLYYLTILMPLPLIVYASAINSTWFLSSVLFYFLVYRTFTDTLRLSAKGLMKKTEFWKMLIPGSRGKFFRALYLEK